MKTIKISILFMMIITQSCGPRSPGTDVIHDTFPEVQSEIKSLVDTILNDGADKNLEALDDYHLKSPKFTRVDNSGLLSYAEGKEKEENFYGNYDILNYYIHNHKVDVYGDMAISSFFLDMTAVIHSDTLNLRSMLSLTFARDKGEWKIVHEHISPRQE